MANNGWKKGEGAATEHSGAEPLLGKMTEGIKIKYFMNYILGVTYISNPCILIFPS